MANGDVHEGEVNFSTAHALNNNFSQKTAVCGALDSIRVLLLDAALSKYPTSNNNWPYAFNEAA